MSILLNSVRLQQADPLLSYSVNSSLSKVRHSPSQSPVCLQSSARLCMFTADSLTLLSVPLHTAMRASLESLRASTATLASDLEQHQTSYEKLSEVSEAWKKVLEQTSAVGGGGEQNGA